MQDQIYLGNLSSKRDWGHARDYIEAMYLMLQQDKPEDFVIATGVTTTIREMLSMAFNEVGIEVEFQGSGGDEVGIVKACNNPAYQLKQGKVVVAVDPRYFRPTEVDLLIGDATKAKEKMGWEPTYDLKTLISEMMKSDVELTKKETYLKDGGYDTLNYYE